ncbi:DUF4350 domain-containing protein [Roseiflexus castenholzii]|jgi:hypothetical protein|uniref:DUF4350 domain-containing protein n=1 Tax=Roseiflexus castenholzii (strain DSM 13941 / HLO8) TaxID=383372 RepID=A7NM36_ROSCS|nr:DUF4350 domain-containing protein [Roseiflexus castenholzii]ABU58591.1 conserved hypothetical protein [Roseiflexus castenholzii DSM 13941]
MTQVRDLLIIAGLFGVLIVFVVAGPGRTLPQDPNLPSTYSTAPTGALALYEWTRALGYDARRLEYRRFEVTDDDAVLVILSPSEPISRAHARDILAWVERGGTLIFADDAPTGFSASDALLDALQVRTTVLTDTSIVERAPALQPVFDQPPVREISVRTRRTLEFQRNDYAPLFGASGQVLIAGIRIGSGYVYVSASVQLFTNSGLRDPQNAALVLNMLRRLPPGGRILFDEYHHGLIAPPSPTDGLLTTPWGWAGVYVATATALFLLLGGRRFGRAVPLKEETARRSSAEYLDSMADLYRRGGKRRYMLQHFYADFKRRLAQPYGINPHLEDREFVYQLARVRPIDEAALLALLSQLRATPSSDADLLRIVAAADAFIAAQARERL